MELKFEPIKPKTYQAHDTSERQSRRNRNVQPSTQSTTATKMSKKMGDSIDMSFKKTGNANPSEMSVTSIKIHNPLPF